MSPEEPGASQSGERRRTQQFRPLAVHTPLGEDVLLLREFSGTETLGRLFQYSLNMVSENTSIRFEDIIGQNVSVRVQQSASAEPRYFNGYVSSFTQVQAGGDTAEYRASIVPWLWFLTRTADCRIYQDTSIPDIILSVFRDKGFSDFENRLHGDYRPKEYCVQYRESHFRFVSRLMEQEGIYYYFQHENGRHKLILADALSAHEPYPGYEQVQYRPRTETMREEEYISQWLVRREVQPAVYTHTDFDFKAPRKSLLTSSRISRPGAVPDFEVFDFPGEFLETAEGEGYARKRIEEIQAPYEVASGEGDVRGIATGCTFSLEEHPRNDQNREYLVTSTSLFASGGEYESGASEGANFQSTFTAIPSQQPFRSPRLTPRPVIEGPQTAIVTGPSGDEIYTDQYGRVKVQFHWDRRSQANENSSCWIRVAQLWAGKKWGAMFIPRIGQEIIVEFLEGDPDRPLIVGRVYNGEAMPPYTLPDNATMSTIKSNTSKGGGGFNEIRFEDKSGKEQIFIHAQSDEDHKVLNDSREWIGRHRHLIVKKDQKEKVEGDKHLKVLGNQNEQIDGTVSLTAGINRQVKVGMKDAVEAGQEIHLKAGMKVIIEAGLQLTIKGSGGFVDIGPAGVTIQGNLVNINSGGAAGVGSGSKPEAPQEPDAAGGAQAGQVDQAANAPPPPQEVTFSQQATVFQQAAQEGRPTCEQCEAARRAQEQEQFEQPSAPGEGPADQGGQEAPGADSPGQSEGGGDSGTGNPPSGDASQGGP